MIHCVLRVIFVILLVASSCRNEESRQVDARKTIPGRTEEPETLPVLISKSRAENKNIFLVFAFEKCGWCKIFEKYHNDPVVAEILSRYIIVSMIDYDKTPDGKELYQKYGSAGFPSWVILDKNARVILTSEAPMRGVKDRKYNIGYPVGEHEMAYYIHAVKTSSPLITSSECKLLREKLKFYHPGQ